MTYYVLCQLLLATVPAGLSLLLLVWRQAPDSGARLAHTLAIALTPFHSLLGTPSLTAPVLAMKHPGHLQGTSASCWYHLQLLLCVQLTLAMQPAR